MWDQLATREQGGGVQNLTCIAATQLGVVFNTRLSHTVERHFLETTTTETSSTPVKSAPAGRGGSRLTEQRNVDGLPTAARYTRHISATAVAATDSFRK